MSTVCMVVRHLLDREGSSIADTILHGWINAFSSLLQELGHRLEIRQEGAGWLKALPGGEPVYAVPEQDPWAPLLPNVNQSLWEHAAGISLAIYADPLLVYPQAHAASVVLGQSIPVLDMSADTYTAQKREEWLERIKSGLSTVNRIAANNTQFIQWAVSTWPGLYHKLHYIPDWFEPADPVTEENILEKAPMNKEAPRVLFTCPALPRFGISETLRAVEILRRNHEGLCFIFSGAVPAPIRKQMQHWFDNRSCCLLLPPGQAMYRQGDIALFPVKSGPVPLQQVLQAMQSGAAVIGSMHGPLVDMIIHGYNGLLIKAIDSDLIEALSTLIEDAALRRKVGCRARLTRAALNRKTWVSEWSALLKTLIGGE